MTDKFIRLVEKAGLVHNELFDEFNRMADKCYMHGDFDGFYYWLGRANAMTENKYQLIGDLGKYIGPKET